MPRVHGINIVPRRGRGRGRARPSAAFGSATAAAAASPGGSGGAAPSAEKDSSPLAGFSMALESPSPMERGEDVSGDVGRMSLDDGAAGEGVRGEGGDDWKSPAAAAAAALDSNDDEENATAAKPGGSTAAPLPATAPMPAAAMSIRPVARESLDHLEFGAHSFSVQEIHRRSSPQLHRHRNIALELGEVGLAPSLGGSDREPRVETEDNDTGRKSQGAEMNTEEEQMQPLATDAKQQMTRSDEKTTSEIEGKRMSDVEQSTLSQQQQQQQQVEEEPSSDVSGNATRTGEISPNASWLYRRCAAACVQMETPQTPLDLALRTLQSIRSIHDDDDEDDYEARLQRELFASLREGKRRDLDFVFVVISMAAELREDEGLTEESLREAAADAASCAAEGERRGWDAARGDAEEKGDDPLATQPVDPSPKSPLSSPESDRLDTQPMDPPAGRPIADHLYGPTGLPEEERRHQMAAESPQDVDSPTKKYRSRRKKRPTHNKDDAAQKETAEVLQDNSSPIASEKMAAPMVDANGELPGDFPVRKDGLDMQDDDKWSFLPADALLSAKETGGEGEEASPRRVTRSMGPAEEVGHSQKGEEELEPASTSSDKKQTHGGNAVDSDDHEDVTRKAEEDGLDNGGNKKEAIAADEKSDGVVNTPHCPDDEEQEVYTMVKTRKRGDSKGTVRIMFTGITPTQRHMAMIETLGAEYIDSIEEAHTATHVIASGGRTKLRRTPKLMICICRVANILNMQWLEQSAKEQRVLDTDDFLLLGDREAERQYGFVMKETIQNGIIARKKRGGVLGGWSVYICSGVAGNRAPNTKELHLIIDAAGGQVLKSLSNARAYDPAKTIVLTSDPSTASQRREGGVAKAERLGAKVLSTSWLFHTIITQNLFDIDVDDSAVEADTALEPVDGVSRLVRCNSHESLVSAMSSSSPLKRGPTKDSRHLANGVKQSSNADRNDDASVRSTSTRGSRVTHLERAVYPPSAPNIQRKKLNYEESKPSPSQECSTTRDLFISSYQRLLSSDVAAAQTHGLWLDYFDQMNKQSSRSKSKPNTRPKKKGVRCMRGRKRSISPLVTSTTPTDTTKATSAKRSSQTGISLSETARRLLVEDNSYVSFEAYVLFTLAHRSEKLGSSIAKSASGFFPLPTTLSGVSTQQLTLNVRNEACEVFGTLQDVFSLHQRHQSSGMIPEQVIALLTIQAIEAVSALHLLGVVHNDIGLDSFLIVRSAQESSSKKKGRRSDEDKKGPWFLQLIGFGYNSAVLSCEQQCKEAHFERDYQCLANVIHQLLTGGVELALNAPASGSVEFASKPFIKGNLFLRGSLSWCSLIDALMCVGDLASSRESSRAPFRLKYPVNLLDLAASDDDGDSRTQSFVWSYRVLQELSESGNLVGFLEDLSSHNARFIHEETDLATFTCSADDGRQSFACYTSNEGAADQLMKKEGQLQMDTLALAQRETELQQKVIRLEQSKSEHKSMLQRESEVRAREGKLLHREQAHALEVQKLEKMKQDIIRREAQLEEKLRVLWDEGQLSDADHHARSRTKSNEAYSLPDNQNDRKRKHSNGIKPPTPRTSHSSAKEEGQTQDNSQSSREKKVAVRPQEMDGGTFLSPKNAVKRRKANNDQISPLMVLSNNEEADLHVESQESHGSASSSAKKRRKSPKCSLHNLPRSPKRKPQKEQPKKVFVTLDEDSDEED